MHGNFEHSPEEVLIDQALETYNSFMAQSREKQINSTLQNIRNIADQNFGNILQAARSGRIDTLFLGMFDKTRDSVSDELTSQTILRSKTAFTIDKIQETAKQVWQHGGRIEAMREDLLPRQANFAASFRY